MSSKTPTAFGLSLPVGLVGYDAESSAPVQDEVMRLFDECAPRLRRYVGSFGLSAEATEDVVQEVFLELFRHLQRGRSRANLTGWIFRVGHNLALKQRERAARRQRTEGVWDRAVTEVVDPAANPEQQLTEDRRSRRLRAVMRALPERDRRCLYLRAEGLRYRDIARTLGISLGTVAKSLTRGMTRLMNADEG